MSDESKSGIADAGNEIEREKAEATGRNAGSDRAEPAGGAKPNQAEMLPTASLSLLITSFGTQALMSLGQIAHPETHQAEVDLAQARHCIDVLGMLEEKTKNNRTPEEDQLLDEILYELRMLFVQTGK